MKADHITGWSQKISIFAFCALIYFLPISTALVEIFSTIIISVFFFRRMLLVVCPDRTEAHSIAIPKSFLNGPILVYLIINLLSVLFSQDFGLSVRGFVFKVFQGVVIYFSFIENFKSKKQLKIFLVIFLVSISLIVVNGTWQAFFSKGFIHGFGLTQGRVRSCFKHPNDFGAYLVTVIPWLLLLTLSWGGIVFNRAQELNAGKWKKVLGLAASMVLTTLAINVAGMTYSRGAWLAGFCALLIMISLRRRLLWLPIFLGLFFVYVYQPLLVLTRNVSILSDNVAQEQSMVQEKIDAEDRANAQVNAGKTRKARDVYSLEEYLIMLNRNVGIGMGRSMFWKEAYHIIRDYPLLGSGLNTYSKIAPRYKINWGGYPHNCYLQMTAETGFLGLFSFLGIVGTLWWQSISRLKNARDDYWSLTAIGFLAGWGAFLFHSTLDTNFYTVKLGCLLWILMAIIVTVQRHVTRSS